jgi:hypothetical protein
MQQCRIEQNGCLVTLAFTHTLASTNNNQRWHKTAITNNHWLRPCMIVTAVLSHLWHFADRCVNNAVILPCQPSPTVTWQWQYLRGGFEVVKQLVLGLPA